MSEAIPIQNIYFLLCYAWNQLEERDLVEINAEDTTSLQDLLARVLAGGVQFLIRRGFDWGYVLHAEDTARLRGRIDFNLSMKRQLFLRGRMRCEFDEMSYDVLHNRILKTTIANLLYTDGVDDKQKERLGEYVRYLNPVTSIRISPREFRRVQLHNGNHYYRFLLNICELIYESLLPTEETGHSYFRDFIRDENRMPHVFEQFVRNFYMIEQSTYKVSRSRID